MANVLIADHSVSMRKLVERTLVRAGHTVIEAEDGVEALLKASDGRVDLVTTDINMPKNGWSCAAR